MTDNDKAPDLLSNERLLRMAEDDCAVVPRPLCREILRLRAKLAQLDEHLPTVERLTQDLAETETELATLTAELAKFREHADHDAGEILRLGGELAKVTKDRRQEGEAAASAMAGMHSHVAVIEGRMAGLTAELAKVTAERDQWRQRADSRLGLAKTFEAERDAARAEVERLKAVIRQFGRGIRDRNEFAASEVLKCAHDWLRKVPFSGLQDFAAARAAELRKAAGAAAPASPSTNALIQGVEDAASDWCKCVCDYREACRNAPEDGSCDAVRESGRKCDLARGVLEKAIRALAAAAPAGLPRRECKAVDVSAPATSFEDWVRSHAVVGDESRKGEATPAADARQPDDVVKIAEWQVLHREVRRASDDRDKLREALMPHRDLPHPNGIRSNESYTDFACRIIGELGSRLAASEKAKAKLVESEGKAIRLLTGLLKIVRDGLPAEMTKHGQLGALIAAMKSDAAAERAGGAS